MSSRAMGMQAEAIMDCTLCAISVGIVYSLGPNIVVGALGTATTGILAIKDRVNILALETQLYADDDHDNTLTNEIKLLEESEKKNLEYCTASKNLYKSTQDSIDTLAKQFC